MPDARCRCAAARARRPSESSPTDGTGEDRRPATATRGGDIRKVTGAAPAACGAFARRTISKKPACARLAAFSPASALPPAGRRTGCATARASAAAGAMPARPAVERSDDGATPAGASVGLEHDTLAGVQLGRRLSPIASSASRSAASRSRGARPRSGPGRRCGLSDSRTMRSPVCAVACQCTRRRLSPCWYGAHAAEVPGEGEGGATVALLVRAVPRCRSRVCARGPAGRRAAAAAARRTWSRTTRAARRGLRWPSRTVTVEMTSRRGAAR